MAIHVNEEGNIKDLVGIENNVSFFEKVLTLNFNYTLGTVDWTPVYLNKSLENYTGFMYLKGSNGSGSGNPSAEDSIVSLIQVLGGTWSIATINGDKCRCVNSGGYGGWGSFAIYMPEDLTKNYLYYSYNDQGSWHFILYAF